MTSINAASVATAEASSTMGLQNTVFPQGFLWGASTAGHQIEGNNVNSDCWAEEHVEGTAFREPSGDAANSFELWPMDIDLVRRMRFNAYRFSLEWARIEPEPGLFSRAMLDHYKAMIDRCREHEITPVVTFNHFTNPRWFGLRGGWINDEAPKFFGRFCERAADHLAENIGYAVTLNEPNLAGVLHLVLPPEVGDNALRADKLMSEAVARKYNVPLFLAGYSLWIPDPDHARDNLLKAHSLGRQAIKAVRADLPVGVALAVIDDQAEGPSSKRETMRELLYGPWLRAVRNDDFIGVQNYERAVWTDKGKLPPPPGAETNQMGAEIYPSSLAGAVQYAYSVSGVPIIVTEHGVGTEDDKIRQRLIPTALAELKRTMDDGVPVRGYFHWSLLDNFEWISGFHIKFGLHSIDRTTFERTPKPSAAILSAIVERNSL